MVRPRANRGLRGSVGTAMSLVPKAPNKSKSTIIHSKYKSYCKTCHYTIWVNEKVRYNGKVMHMNCKQAILDPTPRIIDPKFTKTFGKVKKSKLKDKL